MRYRMYKFNNRMQRESATSSSPHASSSCHNGQMRDAYHLCMRILIWQRPYTCVKHTKITYLAHTLCGCGSMACRMQRMMGAGHVAMQHMKCNPAECAVSALCLPTSAKADQMHRLQRAGRWTHSEAERPHQLPNHKCGSHQIH
jgi:hypothetical protein